MNKVRIEFLLKSVKSIQSNLLQNRYGNVKDILEELRIQLEEDLK